MPSLLGVSCPKCFDSEDSSNSDVLPLALARAEGAEVKKTLLQSHGKTSIRSVISSLTKDRWAGTVSSAGMSTGKAAFQFSFSGVGRFRFGLACHASASRKLGTDCSGIAIDERGMLITNGKASHFCPRIDDGDQLTLAVNLESNLLYIALNGRLLDNKQLPSRFRSFGRRRVQLARFAIKLPESMKGLKLYPSVSVKGACVAQADFTSCEIPPQLASCGFVCIGPWLANHAKFQSTDACIAPPKSSHQIPGAWESFFVTMGCSPHSRVCINRHWWASLAQSLGGQCVICMADLRSTEDERSAVILPCNHKFHMLVLPFF